MRADAAANRQRVVAAAERVFAEQGFGASTEEVARCAGVGIATVFRNFPAKRDLVASVMLGRLEEVTDLARAAESRSDVTTALFELIEQLVDRVADKLAMASYLSGEEDWAGPVKQASEALSAVIERVLRRAQRSGGVRDDIGVDELQLLILGLAHSGVGVAGPDEHLTRQRAARVVLDGLRATRPK